LFEKHNNKVLAIVGKFATKWLLVFHFTEIELVTLTLKSYWLFYFTVPFSLAEKKK